MSRAAIDLAYYAAMSFDGSSLETECCPDPDPGLDQGTAYIDGSSLRVETSCVSCGENLPSVTFDIEFNQTNADDD